MAVASLRNLLQSGQVMHAAIASLLTLTSLFIVMDQSSLSHLTQVCVYVWVCVSYAYPPQCMQIYVHFARITCINTTMTKNLTYTLRKSRIKGRIVRYYVQRKKERKGPRQCGSVKNVIERRWVGEIGRGFRQSLLDSNRVGVVELDLNPKERSL